MNIVILSGGSGNDALIKGLNALYPKAKVDVIVNAYDNGKSTGVCRAVTDTLGVSDIRKNHSRLYKAINGDDVDQRIMEFYDSRYNFTKGNEVNEISELLIKWGMTQFIDIVIDFFNNPKANDYEFKDFSVANIVYAQMYKQFGYESTNAYFCNFLQLRDFVTLNSFDNIYIMAQTESGHVIKDEGETVFWNNPHDKIVKTIYKLDGESYGLNPKAINLIENADLIVISTGTFWSSIQPTIEYLDFYKYINASKAKKIWTMNCEEDGDSFGVTDLDFIKYMEQTGLDLSDFTILLNSDARDSLKLADSTHTFVLYPMGNKKGKHDSAIYAKVILLIYYGLFDLSCNSYDGIIFDFDDTIWSRDPKDIECSKNNIKLINDNLSNNSVIISGNSYRSIKDKLYSVFGTNLDNFNIPIWADANSTEYIKDTPVRYIDELEINDNGLEEISALIKKYDLNIEKVGSRNFNYKIKPLSNLERKLLSDIVNLTCKNIKAEITGNTTVDILNLNNTKEVTYKFNNFKNQIYIGDELDTGNDSSISKLCKKSIQVDDVYETNVLVKLLIDRGM